MGKFSVQERIAAYQNLISIYEKELSKSPQDRLLRLSRETVRNLISYFSQNLPKINLDKKSFHLCLYAANMDGWKNLNKLISVREKI